MALTDQIFDCHESSKRLESAVTDVYVECCSKILLGFSTEFYYRTLHKT
jgi:hypothetical protein